MFGLDCNGGDEEDRTLDLTDANRTLSQLSYAPTFSQQALHACAKSACLHGQNRCESAARPNSFYIIAIFFAIVKCFLRRILIFLRRAVLYFSFMKNSGDAVSSAVDGLPDQHETEINPGQPPSTESRAGRTVVPPALSFSALYRHSSDCRNRGVFPRLCRRGERFFHRPIIFGWLPQVILPAGQPASDPPLVPAPSPAHLHRASASASAWGFPRRRGSGGSGISPARTPAPALPGGIPPA